MLIKELIFIQIERLLSAQWWSLCMVLLSTIML